MNRNFDISVALEAGFAPTPEEVGRRMMRAANLRKGEIFYDLGSGDGKLLIIATKEFGANAVGVEIQGKLVKNSRNKILNLGLEDLIKVINGDFFKVDISDADVVGLYLTPWVLTRLRLKMEKELKSGSRVVVYKFPIESWKPNKICNALDGNEQNKIFVYNIGK